MIDPRCKEQRNLWYFIFQNQKISEYVYNIKFDMLIN